MDINREPGCLTFDEARELLRESIAEDAGAIDEPSDPIARSLMWIEDADYNMRRRRNRGTQPYEVIPMSAFQNYAFGVV
jgi:hypothetical protein